LDSKWHSKLADFGDSKVIDEDEVLEELKKLSLDPKRKLSAQSEEMMEDPEEFNFDNPRGIDEPM